MTPAQSFSFSAEVIEQALINIYSDKFSPMNDIELGLFTEFWSKLNLATQEGFDLSDYSPSYDFRELIVENNAVFSAFKTHRMQRDMAALLLDENGQRKPFNKWMNDVRPIADHQVYNWFRTEYTTAINRAHQAADWLQFVDEADVLPNLEWMPSTAKHPREIHEQYYGLILPIEHPFWDKERPGNRWNCQCGLAATDAERTPEDEIPSSRPKPSNGLENNPVDDGMIFSHSHPYIASASTNSKEAVSDFIGTLLYDKKVTPEIRDAIYALDYDSQFTQVAASKEGYKIFKHLLVDESKTDYNEVLLVAQAFANDGDVWINPEINSKAVEARDKIYSGHNYATANPDLKTSLGYVEVKSPYEFENLSRNASQALKQSDIVVLTDLRLENKLNKYDIERLLIRLWNNKSYTKNQIRIYTNGKLYIYNKPQ